MPQAPIFSTFDPVIYNTGTTIRISLPIGNVGEAAANSVEVTSVSLGTALLISPLYYPLGLGTLAVGNQVALNAQFTTGSLLANTKLLMTVKGTYLVGAVTLGFSVNRVLVVPTAAPLPFALLNAGVAVSLEPSTWSYTLHNREAIESGFFVSAFALDVKMPFVVTSVPKGWSYSSDLTSHILWYASDPKMIANHVPPGGTLAGFQIQSSSPNSQATPFTLSSWNHITNSAGTVIPDVILTPGP